MFAVYRYGGQFFVEPALAIEEGRVLIRLQRKPTWVEPFDLVHVGEDPTRHVPSEQRTEIHYAGVPGLHHAGKSILRPSAADERREEEAWEAENVVED